jgi:hypothetical protein
MKDETDTAVHAVFQELITSLQIRGVQFIEIQSKRSSATFAPEDSNGETSISWKQLFPPDDPLRVEDTLLVFRPKYEFVLARDEKPFFTATMIAAIQFCIENKETFERCWGNPEAQKVFREKQIVRTMWTILRQQLMDCMSRHSLNPVPLPWIV